MKKFIATIFLLTYFVTSSGATIQLHYCMDKLVGWSFSAKAKTICDKCGMVKKEHRGCCHDENKLIKVDKDHKASAPDFDFQKLVFQPFHNKFTVTEQFYAVHPVIVYPLTNAPPLTAVPLYIYNSVFRI